MKHDDNSPEINFLPIIMAVYIVVVLSGMILIYHDYYYDILETKLSWYKTCTIIMLVLVGLYLFLMSHPIEAIRANKGKKLLEIISPVDIAVLLWGIFILLATIFSPVRRDAFSGIQGRYTGCSLLMLYIVAYFCITRFYKLREWHMVIFLGAGIFMCLFGITDFFDMDLLNFKVDISQEQRFLFCSTIGNINTYTSCVAMVMAFAGVMFASVTDKKRVIGYGICTIISFIALILGESDNAYLSLAAFFGLLPFYLFQSRKGVKRYFVLIASFFSVIKGVEVVQQKVDTPISIHGLFQVIAGNKFLPMIVIVLWLIVIINYLADFRLKSLKPSAFQRNSEQSISLKNSESPISPWFVRGWLVLCILVVAAVVFVLYDVNIAGNADKYGGIKDYLLFNDEWGTHRGYIWRIGIEDYQKFPLLQKIFGYGPDTFGIITQENNMPDMFDRYGEVFDSAHNEYLQYFVTIGPFGLLSYLAIHITAVVQVFREKRNNPLVVATLFAVLCYAFQAFVNINQPIATPVMWTLLAICAAKGAKETEQL